MMGEGTESGARQDASHPYPSQVMQLTMRGDGGDIFALVEPRRCSTSPARAARPNDHHAWADLSVLCHGVAIHHLSTFAVAARKNGIGRSAIL